MAGCLEWKLVVLLAAMKDSLDKQMADKTEPTMAEKLVVRMVHTMVEQTAKWKVVLTVLSKAAL